MKLVVYTQCYENYGDEQNPRWKGKGGSDIIIAHPSHNEVIKLGTKGLQEIVNRAKALVDKDLTYFQEYIIDWNLIEDYEPTQWEKDQLEYEGKIKFPSKDISADLLETA